MTEVLKDTKRSTQRRAGRSAKTFHLPHAADLVRLVLLAGESGLMNDRMPSDAEDAEFSELFKSIMATGYRFKGVSAHIDDCCALCIQMKKDDVWKSVYPEVYAERMSGPQH